MALETQRLAFGNGTSQDWWKTKYYDGMAFTWDLLYLCNYRCSYCWFEMEQRWDELAGKYPLIPQGRWLSAWERVHAKYGPARIYVLGGEPLIYPSALELFGKLSSMHYVYVTTNLSPPMGFFQKLSEQIDPKFLHVEATYHPQFADYETFKRKIFFLKEKKFDPSVVYVAYPPHMPQMLRAMKDFQDNGVTFGPIVFRGFYNGKSYPESYTSEEKKTLRLGVEEESRWTYQVEQRSTLGKLCTSGQIYANVKADGSVYRCGSDMQAQSPSLGNILREDFALWEKPRPCPYKQCSCQEYMFLVEEQAKLKASVALETV